jgi:hypothetical protein
VTGLRISPDLALPLEAVTETFGILAIRGAGKTYTGAVMAEELLKAGLPVVVADPLGVWWGLRSSADGEGPGLPIIVMGGEHGDVPLEASAGKVVADFVVQERASVVIDMAEFRKGDVRRFMTDFLEELYHRNREPLHLILEEADIVAPQKAPPDGARLLGAAEDIVRRGRSRGIGVTMITQRSAVINKDVLNQIGTLISMRIMGKQDLDAVEAWVKRFIPPEQLGEFMASLPALPTGTGWIWSPQFLELFKRVAIRKRETFDSSATPTAGARPVAPKRMADVDLEALKGRMAATIEKAKADDPKELRRQIADLKKQLAAPAAIPAPQVERVEVEKVVEVSAVTAQDRDALLAMATSIHQAAKLLVPAISEARAIVTAAEEAVDRILDTQGAAADASRSRVRARPAGTSGGKLPSATAKAAAVPSMHEARPAAHSHALRAGRAAEPESSNGAFHPSGSQQKVLDALAWFEVVGISPASRPQVGMVAGMKHTGGHYANVVSSLRTAGAIDYGGAGLLQLTDSGRAVAVAPDAPVTSDALQDMLLRQLTGSQRKIIEVVIESYPEELSREELADRSGMNAGGGHFANVVSSLRTLGLVDYAGPGRVVGTETLWLP